MAASPRLTDVAAAAGVSLATASRALTGRGSVASATRERVQRAAASLDFHPSAAGQTLRNQSTRMIGFIVPDISSGFYANALKGAQHRLQAAGYQITLMDTDERPDRERAGSTGSSSARRAATDLRSGRSNGDSACRSSASTTWWTASGRAG